MTAKVSAIDPKVIRPEHRRRLFELLQLMHAEQGINELAPFSAPKVEAMIDLVLNTGIVGIALEDDEVVGSVGILQAQWWFTEAWHWEEKWIFVHPDHRRGASAHAQNLLGFAKVVKGLRFGPENLSYPMYVSVLSRHRTAGKTRLFGRHFKPAGYIFVSDD